jgi:hypothetical protein
MTSVLNVDEIAAKDGTSAVTLTKQLALKAFSNFDQATINDSFNTSSMTDNGTGDYQINYTNSMSNANYGISSLGIHDVGSYTRIATYDHDDPATTSNFTLNTQDTNGTQGDAEPCNILIAGDLA